MFDDYSTQTLREALRLARHALRLLAAPDRWTRHVWARDRRRKEVYPGSVAAVRWCAGGAIIAANRDLYSNRGDLEEIPIDPLTGEAVMVERPRRVVAALHALGIGFMATSRERIKTSPPARTLSGRPQPPLAKQHPTLRASDINDLPAIHHPHVALALAWMMAALHDELERRRGDAPRKRVSGAA